MTEEQRDAYFKSEVKKGLEAMRVMEKKRIYFERLYQWNRFLETLNKIKLSIIYGLSRAFKFKK